MEIVTQTIYTTETGFLSFHPTATIESIATISTETLKTYTATLGETITIIPSWPSPQPMSAAPFNSAPDNLVTVTTTEIAVIIQDLQNNPYSTWTIPITATSTDLSNSQPSPSLFVINPQTNDSSGWDSWSSAEKGGLVAGVVIAFLILISIVLFLLFKKRRVWIANDWTVRSHPDWSPYQTGQMVVYGRPGYGR